jgi:hypothetical protein
LSSDLKEDAMNIGGFVPKTIKAGQVGVEGVISGSGLDVELPSVTFRIAGTANNDAEIIVDEISPNSVFQNRINITFTVTMSAQSGDRDLVLTDSATNASDTLVTALNVSR